MSNSLIMTDPRRQPLDVLLRRNDRGDEAPVEFDFSTPIDRSRWFVCPTLTPLYYTRIYQQLSADQRRRYNQLTALGFNELIAFFEGTFAASVLAALADARHRQMNDELADCLARFISDEQRHIAWWRELNRLSEPSWYAKSDGNMIRISPGARRLLAALTSWPHRFPAVFWVMLALEERSLDISRRCMKMDRDRIEPRYRAIYQQHLKDESQHVQFDWHLIERFYMNRSRAVRWTNAKLLRLLIGRFFLPPTRSAVRVVRRLTVEHPELAPRQPEIIRQLKALRDNPDYHDMMYSPTVTPVTFALFDRFEEMHAMRHVLRSYHPRQQGTNGGSIR